MDTATDTPSLSQAFAGHVPTPPSTCSSRPSATSRPSAKTRDLIARLGLRYRPTSAADLEAHAALLALLAQDVALIPTDLLERAIAKHVASSPYMPKASELIRLAHSFLAPPTIQRGGESYAHDLADEYNRRLAQRDPAKAAQMEWFVDHAGDLKLRHKACPTPGAAR